MEPASRTRYWERTQTRMLVVLALVILMAVVIPLFALPLNRFQAFGFPLGFLIAAQGAPVGLLVLLFWFVRRQNRADDRQG